MFRVQVCTIRRVHTQPLSNCAYVRCLEMMMWTLVQYETHIDLIDSIEYIQFVAGGLVGQTQAHVLAVVLLSLLLVV